MFGAVYLGFPVIGCFVSLWEGWRWAHCFCGLCLWFRLCLLFLLFSFVLVRWVCDLLGFDYMAVTTLFETRVFAIFMWVLLSVFLVADMVG